MRITTGFLITMCAASAAMADARSAWATAGEAHDIDILTLYAVALQESRTLWTDGTARPWPWTLRATATGARRFPTREAAHAALEALLAVGERNIDVGLMQVNVAYHGHRVDTPPDLLDPRRNILVAAEILREALEDEAGDLARALGSYHHGTETARGRAYSAEVRHRLERLRVVPGLARSLGSDAVVPRNGAERP